MSISTLRTSRPARPAGAVPLTPDRELWNALLNYLRTNHPDLCRGWFDDIEPLGVEGLQFPLRAHSTIHRDYLQRACLKIFNEAVQTVSGRLLTIRFLGPDESLSGTGPRSSAAAPAPQGAGSVAPAWPVAANPSAPPGATPIVDVQVAPPRTSAEPDAIANMPAEPEMGAVAPGGGVAGAGVAGGAMALSAGQGLAPAQLEHLHDDGLRVDPDYLFENFIVGPSNRMAHAAGIAVAANPGRAYNPFFVHGGVGLGKTHLLQAICLSIHAQRPGAVIYYTSCEGFMTQFFDAVQAGQMNRFRYKFRHVDVLVIDDVHFLSRRDRTQEEFFHTFNSLHQNHKQIILSSDARPEEIPDLEDRLVSRFNWGLVSRIDPPCYETRVAIVKHKARARRLEISDEVACYVAGKIERNIRELEGAITSLHMLSNLESRPVDLAMARAALQDDGARPEPKIQIQSIINAVTDYFGVKVTDLQSKRRQRSIALPRQVCMFLARRHTRFSLEEIGGYFGGRDHTTVMHAVKTIADRCERDEAFREVTKSLEDRLRMG